MTISAPSPQLPSDDEATGDLGDNVGPLVIVNLEQSLQGDISLEDVTPSPLSQPLTAELVGSEQSGRTNNCSSSVFDGLILNSEVRADSGDDLSLCGGERVIVGSLSSGQLSSLHDRELFPSLTDALKKKVLNITINNKQHANKNQKIVIIKPLADSSKSIFSDPVKFTKALLEGPFNYDQIKEIHTNKQSQTIVAELIVPNQNLLNKLLSLNQIGEWPVECYIPMRDKFKYGVIYPVDLDLGKLKHDINIENGVQVAKIGRIECKEEW